MHLVMCMVTSRTAATEEETRCITDPYNAAAHSQVSAISILMHTCCCNASSDLPEASALRRVITDARPGAEDCVKECRTICKLQHHPRLQCKAVSVQTRQLHPSHGCETVHPEIAVWAVRLKPHAPVQASSVDLWQHFRYTVATLVYLL